LVPLKYLCGPALRHIKYGPKTATVKPAMTMKTACGDFQKGGIAEVAVGRALGSIRFHYDAAGR
jgi:hypothetical protein